MAIGATHVRRELRWQKVIIEDLKLWRRYVVVCEVSAGLQLMGSQMLEVCYRCGVKVLTVYAFSVENFKRSRYEVDTLMSLMKSKLTQLSEHGELFERYGASVRVLGQRELVAPDVLEAIDRAVDLTKNNTDAILNICFPYASRNEITIAIRDTVNDWSQPIRERERTFSQSHIESHIRLRNISNDASKKQDQYSPAPSAISDTEDSIAESTLPVTPADYTELTTLKPSLTYPDPESIDANTLSEHMFITSNPPVDLFIRTSGVERFSDFLLWQAHEKTDIKFVDCMWPDFDLWQLIPILVEWQWKRRKAAADERVARRGMRLPKKSD